MCVCVCARVCVYLCMYIGIYIYIYIFTRIHTHAFEWYIRAHMRNTVGTMMATLNTDLVRTHQSNTS